MSEINEKPVSPDKENVLRKESVENGEAKTDLKKNVLAQVKMMAPIIFGASGNDPRACKEKLLQHVKKLVRNPSQSSLDFWDALFGTGADGISREDDAEKKGKIKLSMDLPDPVRMPDTFSVVYRRLDDKKKEVITQLERDGEGNIHYLDDEKETVFVRTKEGFRRYPVLAGQKGFDEWDGLLLSARNVRRLTEHFWNCADQTFIKWLGVELTEKKEFLGRPCGLYHAQPGTITFTYQCDMVIDDETGICFCYSADKLLKGAVFSKTEDRKIEIRIGEYRIDGGLDINFCCTEFRTENISFDIPAV